MKKIVLVLSTLFVLQSCVKNQIVTHKSSKGYTFSFSNKEWTLEDNKDILILFSTNQTTADFKTNINVLVQDLSFQPMSLNEYHQLTLSQIEQGTGGNNIESEREVIVSGNPAIELIYNIPKDLSRGQNISLKIKQVYTIKDNKAYLVTYTTKPNEFNDYLTSVDNIFNSFIIE